MVLAFPEDPTARPLDRQYLLGPDLLVAPVFSAAGDVELYLPAGTWTHLLTGEQVVGPVWRQERHGFDSLPLYVREGAVLPLGAREDRPDTDHLDGLTLAGLPGRPRAPRGAGRRRGPRGRDHGRRGRRVGSRGLVAAAGRRPHGHLLGRLRSGRAPG